jgi:hypothetical protein
VRLVSRAGKEHSRRFAERAAAIRALPPATLILDGAVAIFDEKLISRFEWFRKRPEDMASTPPIYMAFDCLYLDGQYLRALPLRERRQTLERAVENDHTLIFPARRLADHGPGGVEPRAGARLRGLCGQGSRSRPTRAGALLAQGEGAPLPRRRARAECWREWYFLGLLSVAYLAAPALFSTAVDENQRRAFDLVESLRKFFGEYRTQKEREAYVVLALYLGATGALLLREPPSGARLWLVLIAVVGASFVAAFVVRWQITNLLVAARVVGASVNVSARWLQHPPPPAAIEATQVPDWRNGEAWLPADLATEFENQDLRWLRRAQIGVPVVLVVWGSLVSGAILLDVVGAAYMPSWKVLSLLGLALSLVGVAFITWAAGVRWILPTRHRTVWDVRLWGLAFALILIGTLLQFIGTWMSPT